MSHLHPGEGAAGTAPCRRSARLRSQIHAGDEGAAGVASHRRSTRRSTQIHVIEEVAGLARHRSKRLRPQTHGSEEGDGMPRRSARLRSQIHAGNEHGDGMPRRSARLRSQIHAGNEHGAGVARHRRIKRRSTQIHAIEKGRHRSKRLRRLQALARVLDGEDMVREILLRLPLDLCSLPRASAVCKRWRGILGEPQFLRRFHAHHRKPPLLGVYGKCSLPKEDLELVFTPTPTLTLATTPNRIPAELFSFGQRHSRSGSSVLDCRHGLVLIHHQARAEVLVCDPISGMVRRVVVPEALLYSTSSGYRLWGAVLCAAGEQGHVHGACHSSPFKVVLMCYHFDNRQLLAGVYTSEADTWGHLISRRSPCFARAHTSTLVGNVLYWPVISFPKGSILRLDLDTHILTVIDGPSGANNEEKLRIIQPEDGTVGVAILRHSKLEMWQRNVNSEGVAIWFRSKTVVLSKILEIPPWTGSSKESRLRFVGYDEDTDVIFLARQDGVYMVQTKSMQSRKLLEGSPSPYYCYPFRSLYPPPGTAIAGETNGAEMLG